MLKLHIKFTALIMTLVTCASAQTESDYAIKIDSTNRSNKWKPTGIRVGLDIIAPIYSYFDPKIKKYEVAADVDLNTYFLVIEAGKESYQSNETLTTYSSSGFFYKFGIDINMTKKDINLNTLYFGLRYAISSFSEKLKGELSSTGWANVPINLEQEKSTANWIEMNLGIRVRIWKPLFAGYTLKFKLLKHHTASTPDFESYHIPSYGLASAASNWGINYYIQYRFGWKKKPISWKKE